MSSGSSSSRSGSRPTRRARRPCARRWARPRSFCKAFLAKHPGCYPPLVINITDGHPTDGDPREPAKELRALTSRDGHVLLFNAHVSEKHDRPVEFPEDEAGLPDDFAKLLFRMSSVLPPKLLEAAKSDGFSVGPHSRGFVFNADLVAVIRFLDIGTRVAQGVC